LLQWTVVFMVAWETAKETGISARFSLNIGTFWTGREWHEITRIWDKNASAPLLTQNVIAIMTQPLSLNYE
jgi:hypothetical protein